LDYPKKNKIAVTALRQPSFRYFPGREENINGCLLIADEANRAWLQMGSIHCRCHFRLAWLQ